MQIKKIVQTKQLKRENGRRVNSSEEIWDFIVPLPFSLHSKGKFEQNADDRIFRAIGGN